jgi:hypothetical protein
MRVYLSGKLIIDCTSAGGVNAAGKTQVNLVAGQRYDLVVEYTELTKSATAMLYWAYPGVSQTLIPTNFLYPTPTGQPPSTGQTPANRAPSAALTAPGTGASYTAPAKIGLTASATDADGKVAKVEFFSGDTKIGESITAPYTFTLSGVTPGTYSFSAKATDNAGAATTSSVVSVNVAAPAGGSADLTVPVNLRVQGLWQISTNSATDILTWDPVSGAASYNVYQYDVMVAKGVRSTSCTVPANWFLSRPFLRTSLPPRERITRP